MIAALARIAGFCILHVFTGAKLVLLTAILMHENAPTLEQPSLPDTPTVIEALGARTAQVDYNRFQCVT